MENRKRMPYSEQIMVNRERKIVLIAHNVRSCHNVGSLLRTAEGLGIQRMYLTGYTPYPWQQNDQRLPHVAQKLTKQIEKTALGAEKLLDWQHQQDVLGVISQLQADGYTVYCLEQASKSVLLPELKASKNIAILVGREVEGVEPAVIAACDQTVEIPMFGKKESFNVVQAAAMALYHCRFAQ